MLTGDSFRPSPTCAFSDFKIICGAEYDVDRIILASHSGYFKRLFESEHRDIAGSKLTLSVDSCAAVSAMIQYFYGLSYDKHLIEPLARRHGFVVPENLLYFHSTVFTVANKYDVPGLKDLALEKFHGAATVYNYGGPQSPGPEMLATALMEAVPHVCQHTPVGDNRLREFVVSRFAVDDRRLLKVCEKAMFDKLVMDVPEFARDLIPALTGVRMRRSDTDVRGK